jgi:ribosomal protein S27AE
MSNSDWWSKKMGVPASSKPVTPPTGPTAPVPYTPPTQQPNVQVNYDPNADQLVTRAQSSRLSDRCPECNSGNYFAPKGTQRMRCYDCGYPISQSGSGLPSSGTSGGAATPAKQVGQSGGFNPNVIVDRIG